MLVELVETIVKSNVQSSTMLGRSFASTSSSLFPEKSLMAVAPVVCEDRLTQKIDVELLSMTKNESSC